MLPSSSSARRRGSERDSKTEQPLPPVQEDVYPEWRIPPSGLPISLPTLHLLRRSRQPLEDPERDGIIKRIVDETITPTGNLDGDACVFVLEYVIAGLSLPSPAARENFTAALSNIIDFHLAGSGAEAVDAVSDAILRVYADAAGFNLKRRKTSIEVTLGLFSAVSVLVSADVARYMSARVSRKLLRRMREAVESGQVTSELLPGTLSTPQKLLKVLHLHGKIDWVKTALLKWADERIGTHDGLAIALMLLLDFKLITHEMFLKIYPTRADLRAALVTLFQTGRVFKPAGDINTQHTPAPMDMPWMLFDATQLPLGWVLASKYFGVYIGNQSGNIGRGPGAVTSFWNDIVLPDFGGGAVSYEHALLAIDMLPATFSSLRASGDSGAFLDKRRTRQLVEIVGNYVRGGARPADAWLVGRCRRALENLPSLLFSIGSWPMLAAMKLPYPGSSVFNRADLTNVITRKVGTMSYGMDFDTICSFFANVAFCFLDPTPFDSLTPAEGHQLRQYFAQAMDCAASSAPLLTIPYVYIMLMSSAFKPNAAAGSCPVFHDAADNAVRTDHDPCSGYQESIEAFAKYLCTELDQGPGKVEVSYEALSKLLPFPKAPIDVRKAAALFAYFFEFLAAENDPQKALSLIDFADKFVNAAVRDGKNFVIVQQAHVMDLDRAAIWSLLTSLYSVRDKLDPALFQTLVVVGRILKLMCFAPTHGDKLNIHEKAKPFLDQYTECVKSAVGGLPSTFNRTMRLLLTMCMPVNSMGRLSRVCVEVLGPILTGPAVRAVRRMVHESERKMSEIKADTQTPAGDMAVEKNFSWFLHRVVEIFCGKYEQTEASEQIEAAVDLVSVFSSTLDYMFLATPFMTHTVVPIADLFESLVGVGNEPFEKAVRSTSFTDQLFPEILHHLPKRLPREIFRMARVTMIVLASGNLKEGKRVVSFLNGVWQADVNVFAAFAPVAPTKSILVSSLALTIISAAGTADDQRTQAMKCLSILVPIGVKLHRENSSLASPYWHVVSELHDAMQTKKHAFLEEPAMKKEVLKVFNTGADIGACLRYSGVSHNVSHSATIGEEVV